MGLAVICQLSLTGTAGAAAAATTAKAVTAGSIAPNAVNEVDCNAHSPKYGTVRALASNCADPVRVVNGKRLRFEDNEHYIGHDEPSVKFISSTPGSGNTMTYLTRIPVDPAKSPTASGSVTDYGELSVAPWFGLPMCDPLSFPQGACTPDSDTNNPNAAGSAFMELQLYPPGYTPFIDSTSCSATQWCAALTIDSLSCDASGNCNNNCIEPVNFAYLQTNGVPAGPPNPQQSDVSTLTPNGNTLKINGGDVLRVSITDPPQGFTTTIRDVTTHQTGFMTASAANGFSHTNMADCSGTPFTWHAEYSTAKQQNQVPWAALEGGVLMQQEIGHSEVCSSVTNKDPFSFSNNGQSFNDPNNFDTCVGGSEGPTATGEGPCTPTGICDNATTQGPNGPVACPTNDSNSGALCEFADGSCFQKGTRTALVNGSPVTEVSQANWCNTGRFQNGDLDFDGLDYVPNSWPDGTRNHPTAFEYAGPFLANGRPYPHIQFETNVGGSEALCNTTSGAGCTVPPAGAKFYPFWSLSPQPSALGSHLTSCVWNFGNVIPRTFQTFGKDAQYGKPNVARFAGTSTSAVLPNPQFTGVCAGPI
ncbi:MAG TPA: hypothetical protein VFW50_18740 [Streptosporangiaceae bacterium]|nr:hypothetical protein [Streptosporangiaceae bacterium]